MTKTKSSPGPWHLRHAFGKYELSYDNDIVASMRMSGLPEDADNARLISAAPDLLEALQLLCYEMERTNYYGIGYKPKSNEPLGIAKAALAKVLGHDG